MFSFVMVKLVDDMTKQPTHPIIAHQRAATLSFAIQRMVKQNKGIARTDGLWEGICYNDDGELEGSELFALYGDKHYLADEGGVSCI